MGTEKPTPPEGFTLMLGKDLPPTRPKKLALWQEYSSHWVWEFLPKEADTHPHLWYAFPTPTPTPTPTPSISEEAAAVVAGDRAADYGDANESFTRIAKLWSAYTGSVITPWDVAQMMILLKVSRAKTSTKRDTLVDIIGYAECAGQLKKQTPLRGSLDLVRGHKALDAVKHCQDSMTEEMRANDFAMRNTPPREWTLDQVDQAVETAKHVNKTP